MRFIKFFGAAALMISLPIACVLTINYRASLKAEKFCNAVTIGESISNVIARAESEKAIVVMSTTGSNVQILFHGFVFDHAACKLVVENHLIKSKTFEASHD